MPDSAPADGFSESISLLDPLVVNPGRLSILLALSAGAAADQLSDQPADEPSHEPPALEFVDLRRRTRLTDGNLSSHARRLADGGLIDIAKRFRDGKPVTTYILTVSGRQALQSHVEGLVSAVRIAPPKQRATAQPTFARREAVTATVNDVEPDDDDWID